MAQPVLRRPSPENPNTRSRSTTVEFFSRKPRKGSDGTEVKKNGPPLRGSSCTTGARRDNSSECCHHRQHGSPHGRRSVDHRDERACRRSSRPSLERGRGAASVGGLSRDRVAWCWAGAPARSHGSDQAWADGACSEGRGRRSARSLLPATWRRLRQRVRLDRVLDRILERRLPLRR